MLRDDLTQQGIAAGNHARRFFNLKPKKNGKGNYCL
jgi:hypothetical protein